MKFDEKWLRKLKLDRNGKVWVEVGDEVLIIKPVLEKHRGNAATQRVLDFLSLPAGSLAHLAIPPDRKDEDEFDWNPDEDID